MLFKNFKNACEHYKYPGSHRIGTIANSKGVIRSYSNGTKGDIVMDDKIYYVLKNDKVREWFKKSIESGQRLRFFYKVKSGVQDLGLFRANKFYKNYIQLVK